MWATAHTSVTFDELLDPRTYGVLTNETALAHLPEYLDRLSGSEVSGGWVRVRVRVRVRVGVRV